jgi:hypothetical protein
MVAKEYKVNIPAIFKALSHAEKLIADDDEDMQRSGKVMKRLFLRLLAKRQNDLREAVEKSAKEKRTKFWQEKERKNK